MTLSDEQQQWLDTYPPRADDAPMFAKYRTVLMELLHYKQTASELAAQLAEAKESARRETMFNDLL